MGAIAPFVGRTGELRSLRAWLTESVSLGTRVVLLEGEPGVGKSSLVERLVTDALRRKQPPTVLRATCYQDVHVPYLPLATALRPIGDLAALLRPLIDDTPDRSDERRLHLYLGVADVVERAARDAPLLLVLDDLQWADQGTLDLLAHVLQVSAQSTGGQRLMAVLPHRPVNEGALLEFIERMRRGDWCRELSLQGLDAFALHELVEALTGERPARKLLDGLDEASAGNPLLARSLLERLEAFGVLTVRSGHLTHRGGEELLAGPAELDELLRHRLRDLPRPCLDMLVAASFVGEGEPLEHVRAVMGANEERFHTIVEQAVAARVLRDHDVVRFDHPQVRQVMFQRPRGARRQQLHLRVADHLESLGGDDAARAVAIAHHLRRAGELADADRVVQASLRAATHAAAVVAWGEAARAYDAAIEAAETVHEGSSAFVALLHARSAYAHWYNHDNPGAEQHALAAVAIASRLRDLPLWVEALETLARARWSGVGMGGGQPLSVAEFDDYLAIAGDRDPALSARVHRVRGTVLLQANNAIALARPDLLRAAELVDRDDPRATSDVEFAVGALSFTELDLDRAMRSFRDAYEHVLVAGNALLRVSIVRGQAMVQWSSGDLAGAAASAHQAMELARPIAAWAECSISTAIAAGVALAQGRFDDCEELCTEAERMMRWAGYPVTAQITFPVLACCRATRSDFEGAHRALDLWASAGARGVNRFRPLVNAMAGAWTELPALRQRPVPDILTSFDIAPLAAAVEIGDLSDDMERITWARPGITRVAERGIRFDLGWCFFVPRLAAVAAARSGDDEAAARWFDAAARDAARIGATWEAQRVELDRARLLPLMVESREPGG